MDVAAKLQEAIEWMNYHMTEAMDGLSLEAKCEVFCSVLGFCSDTKSILKHVSDDIRTKFDDMMKVMLNSNEYADYALKMHQKIYNGL